MADSGQVDQLHAALVAGFIPVLGDHFAVDAELDASTWNATLEGSGTLEGFSNRLRTGVTANASASIRSRRRARYLMGTIQAAQFAIGLTDDLDPTNNVRQWGLFDDDDGWFFEQSDGLLHAVIRRDRVDTKVASTSWSRRFTPVLTVAHRYEIRVTHHSNDVVGFDFLVDGALGFRSRSNDGPSSPLQIELPLTIANANSAGGTADVGLEVHGATAGRYGLVRGHDPRSHRLGSTTAQVKNKCGRLQRVIVGVPGADGDTLTLYNGTSSGAEVLITLDVSLMREVECGFNFDQLYAEFSADAGGDVVVVFD
jgi:hypothetical protein